MEAALNQSVARIGELEIRPAAFVAPASGRRLHLTVRELELLTALAERRDRIVGRGELSGWGGREGPIASPTVRSTYVPKLRLKLTRRSPIGASSIPISGPGTAFSPEPRSE